MKKKRDYILKSIMGFIQALFTASVNFYGLILFLFFNVMFIFISSPLLCCRILNNDFFYKHHEQLIITNHYNVKSNFLPLLLNYRLHRVALLF